ncbi:MAG: permease-like cell division protein FtsX [Candidatus Peribacteraceae bacterium]|nr:permease-like cell division protein FtsX [Candidatus Peribacteraceae bacterium]
MKEGFRSTLALWKRSIRRGYDNMLRERNRLATWSALTGIFLLLQGSILVFLGIVGAESFLKSRTNLHLELLDAANDQEVQTFLSAVQNLPYVEQVNYITKEQAYAKMKEHDPELIAFIEELKLENPFPETAAVTLGRLDQYESFAGFLREERWRSIVDPSFLSQKTNQEAYVYELLQFTGTGRIAAIFFVVLTAGILLFITTELVRERVLRRKEEILVEQLSGAFSFNILLPYAMEAIIVLAIAAAMSIALCAGIGMLLLQIAPLPEGESAIGQLWESIYPLIGAYAPIILLLEIIAIPLIGWLGTWLGMLPKIHARALVLLRQ